MTANRVYGYSQDTFLIRRGVGDTYVFGGRSQDGSRWTRILSKRAAHMLWFHLARHLFPDDADDVTARLPTALFRGVNVPSITEHMLIEPLNTGGIEIVGSTSAGTYSVQLGPSEVQRFWTLIDQAMDS